MLITKEINLGGKPLTLETGRLARQADGSVMIRYGDTMVLATVVSAREPKEGQDFFPLQVEYREKTAAVVVPAEAVGGNAVSRRPGVGSMQTLARPSRE